MGSLPTADEVHDFHPVAFADDDLGEALALQNSQVVLHRHPSGIDVQSRQQRDYRHRLVELEIFTVQCNNQCVGGRLRLQPVLMRSSVARVIRASQGKPLTCIGLRLFQ